MLSEISWGNYITGITILLALYYMAVALLYYRKEIMQFISRNRHAASLAPQAAGSIDTNGNDLEEIVNEIDSILERAGKEAGKQELLRQLRGPANSTRLGEPAYRAAVYNHIIRKAEEICGQRISAQELEDKG